MQGYKQLIQNIEIKTLDKEMIEGLQTMLSLDTFSNLHPLIKQKLQEYEDHKKQEKETIIGGFEIKAGKYYLTTNNSIVFCLGVTSDERDGIVRMVVIEGGYIDKDVPTAMGLALYGDTRQYGCYASDKMGRCCAALDENDYPMHIIKSVEAKFTVDK